MNRAIIKFTVLFSVAVLCSFIVKGEDGYDLWLRKGPAKPVKVVVTGKKSATLDAAKDELIQFWQGTPNTTVQLVIKNDKTIKPDGFKINGTVVTASTDAGVLYGVYDLLRRTATGQSTNNVLSNPSYQRRLLNHWDNPTGSIEHGFAGKSIFWRNEKDSVTVNDGDISRWKDYARINASVGINGAVINNVNASPMMLSAPYLKKAAAIANAMRPYGMKIYIAPNFASPIRQGGLKTADPLDPEVIKYWQAKAKEIYALIPDFGGFLVKANSEGQPGPQDYKRTHVDGANLLADAVKPFGGIVMWRAFVYAANDPDRAKQAVQEFMPFDGQFRDNVIIQVKNGPVDFQPREPFSPLFGAMKKTSVMPEFQIMQEYLGQAKQLVFLSTMWEECLKSDTYQAGTGSTVGKVTDGSIYPQKYTAIAGVSNIGLDSNWTAHPFAAANWYAFGRLAWDNTLTSEQIADEWLKLTFAPVTDEGKTAMAAKNWDSAFLAPVKKMMLDSREAAVNYMMPLGLHHQFSSYDHYGPGPWYAPARTRADWTPPYYHKADKQGIGFNRTKTGTDAVSQYHEPLASTFGSLENCPEIYLLWFHHVPWTYKMKSGRTLWDELCIKYDTGVKQVRQFQVVWDMAEPFVDKERFTNVQSRLRIHVRDAQVWKDASILYFQTFSGMPIPYEVERPVRDLSYMMSTPPANIK
ncbi:alpha-glucuronidase family glycosyl hydrolase [Mucilaginibacter puniceus]